jgi:ABC-type transport system involved in cytochrome c biogenesis permease subunit
MPGAMLDGVSLLWFGASYGVALLLEIVRLWRPAPILRVLSLIALGAGLAAHTLYVVPKFFLAQQPPLATPDGSLVFLAWILAVFALYGSLHHPKVAWNLFVLPVLLGLVGLAAWFSQGSPVPSPGWEGERVWGIAHGVILLLASVGVSVGFVASVMYLVQARRLRDKTPPGKGLQMLSLERLETMNRHAVIWAFPLLTVGVLIGLFQLIPHASELRGWADPKIWGAAGLWVVFGLLLVLRLARQLQGRRAAFVTIVAFVVLIFTLAASHTVVQGSNP